MDPLGGRAVGSVSPRLQNNLAHANDLGTDSWPEIAPVVIQIERLLRQLERDYPEYAEVQGGHLSGPN